MSSIGSVTKLVGLIKQGDVSAAQRLWDLFAVRMLALARLSLGNRPFAVADEEDVVQSALTSFFSGMDEGKFTRLTDREALWHLLSRITTRKAINLIQRERSAKRKHSNSLDTASDSPAALSVVDYRVSPDMHALLEDEFQRLLNGLGDSELRTIALWKMEAFTDAEIAVRLGCAVRTIERKLQLIRKLWCKEEIR